MGTISLWRRVHSTAQAYEDANGVHKMGKIHEGDLVYLIEQYRVGKDVWYRIDWEYSTAPDLDPPHDVHRNPQPIEEADYNQWWVKDRMEPQLFGPVTTLPDSPEDPTEPQEPLSVSDAELGAAVRLVLQEIARIFS